MVTDYRAKAFWYYKNRICKRCSIGLDLTVHHRDGNRKNNDVYNLEILCRDCHDEEHGMKKPIPRKKINKKYQPGTPKHKRK